MLFNEMHNHLKSFEKLQSKFQAKANEALQDAQTFSLMVAFIQQQLMSTKKVTYQRPPHAQRPVSMFQSSLHERGNETGTSSDETETLSSEEASLHRRPAAKSSSSDPFTMKLRPRGCRGKVSTAKYKETYERERNKCRERETSFSQY